MRNSNELILKFLKITLRIEDTKAINQHVKHLFASVFSVCMKNCKRNSSTARALERFLL